MLLFALSIEQQHYARATLDINQELIFSAGGGLDSFNFPRLNFAGAAYHLMGSMNNDFADFDDEYCSNGGDIHEASVEEDSAYTSYYENTGNPTIVQASLKFPKGFNKNLKNIKNMNEQLKKAPKPKIDLNDPKHFRTVHFGEKAPSAPGGTEGGKVIDFNEAKAEF